MDVVKPYADVKTIHDTSKTTIHASTADGLEMTSLNPEAHFRQGEMTDLDPEDIQAEMTDPDQAKMTDLDQAEMTDLDQRT